MKRLHHVDVSWQETRHEREKQRHQRTQRAILRTRGRCKLPRFPKRQCAPDKHRRLALTLPAKFDRRNVPWPMCLYRKT